MKKSIRILLTGILALFLIAPGSFAGTIDPALEAEMNAGSPDGEFSVIITLSDRVNVRQFKEKDKRTERDRVIRKARRSKMIRALRKKADEKQKPLTAILKRKGARNIVPLWINNSIAVKARAVVLREIADYPGVESIRPDSRQAI